MKKDNQADHDGIQPEYDFSAGERGKFAKRFSEGTNLVALAPDVIEAFPDSASVNEALRLLIKISSRQQTAHS